MFAYLDGVQGETILLLRLLFLMFYLKLFKVRSCPLWSLVRAMSIGA